MKDKILKAISKKGPMLPIEIGGVIGADSFLAKALLEELIESGNIKESKEKVGNSHLYFISGQEHRVQEKINYLSSQSKTARVFMKSKVDLSPELAKKQQEFSDRAARILAEEQRRKSTMKSQAKPISKPQSERKMYHPKLQHKSELRPNMKASIPSRKIVSNHPQRFQQTRPIIQKSPEPALTYGSTNLKSNNFVDYGMQYLLDIGAEIIDTNEVKKNKVIDVIAKIPSSLGNIKFLVNIKDKKSISKSDLSDVYIKALEKGLPGFMLTSGKVTKAAEKYMDSVKGFIKAKKIQF